MNALILIDIQYDFMPGGALAVPEGDMIVTVANRLISEFDLVVATQDWHPENHQSFASQHNEKQVGDLVDLEGSEQILWPDHCIQGTQGAELHAQLEVDGIHRVFYKGIDPKIDSYSGFYDNDLRQSTGLFEFLSEHGISEVVIMGLATDYCVKFTALDAVKLGLKTSVIQEGCRGVDLNPGDVWRAYEEMKMAGVVLI